MIVFRIILILAIPVSSFAQVANWEPAGMPMYPNDIRCIYNDTVDDLLYVGGYIKPTIVGNDQNQKLCVYDGSSWDCFDSFGGPIEAIIRFDGELFVGGWFCEINGNAMCGGARWDGSDWHPLTNWEPIQGGVINNFKVWNDELYAFGSFDSINGKELHGIAKWTGSDWESVNDFYAGQYLDGFYVTDATMFQGKLYVAGNFNYDGVADLLVFDQGEWRAVEGSFHGSLNVVTRIQVYKDELYAIGSISKPAGNVGHGIQKWDGQFWTQVGDGIADTDGTQTNGFTNVREMVVHNDLLYVVGPYRWVSGLEAPCGVGRWDGQQWCTDTTLQLQQGADAIGFYHDTLFIGFSKNDSIVNGEQTRCILKYTEVDIQDTCSEVYPVGTNELAVQQLSDQFKVYPNPAADAVNISWDNLNIGRIEVTLSDIRGAVVYREDVFGSSKSTTMPLSGIEPGVYLLSLSSNTESLSAVKLVVQ